MLTLLVTLAPLQWHVGCYLVKGCRRSISLTILPPTTALNSAAIWNRYLQAVMHLC